MQSYSTETPADAGPQAPRAPCSTSPAQPSAVASRPSPACASSPAPAPSRSTAATLEDYFPNKLHQQLINDPFKVLDLARQLRRHRQDHRRRPLGPGRRAAPRHRPFAERDRPREQPRRPSRRPASSLVTLASSSARRPVSRRPARLRSSRSANPRAMPASCLGFSAPTVSGGSPTATSPPTSPWAWPRRPPSSSARVVTPTSGAPPGRRPVAVVARDPRVSGEFISAAVAAGLASSGVDVLDAGRHPDPGGRVPDRRHRRRLRRHDLGVAQPGARQRHQVLRRRRHQAARRGRGPHRGRARPSRSCARPAREVGRIRRFADAEDRYVVHLLGDAAAPPRRHPRRARLRPRRGSRRLARGVHATPARGSP